MLPCSNPWAADACGWSFGYLWRSTDWLVRGDVALLLLMLANTIAIICDRLYVYSAAKRQSRGFVRDAAAALRDGDLNEVTTIAARNLQSHVASVIVAGLTAFASAPAHLSDAEAINLAERASQRRRETLASELGLGVGTLTTIVSTAPFIGLLGTVFGIFGAFGGIAMAKSTLIAMVESTLALALVTTALGLAVAIPATWCRNYFLDRLEVFRSEMSNAALEATTNLRVHSQLRSQPGYPSAKLFAARSPSAAGSWEIPFDRQWAPLLGVGFCALYLASLLAQGIYWSDIRQRSQAQETYKWEYVEGRELLSPDHRYRAVIPGFVRFKVDSLDKLAGAQWSCQTPEVALRILRNDRPLAGKPRVCNEGPRYALEPDEAVLTWNCASPVMMWRTNIDLVLLCDDCSTENLQVAQLDSFPHQIEVRGADGKRIDPQVVHPELQCYY